MTEPTTSVILEPDPTRAERLQVLGMLESGAITADEAAALLDVLERHDRGNVLPLAPATASARQFRLRVTKGDAARAMVNVTVPIGLVESGLNFARQFVPDLLPTLEEIRDRFTSDRRGPILEIHDPGHRIEIIVE